jgi:hypothetical protein
LASYDPPISTLRKQSGWMRRVIRACGKSLTNTSLTTMGHLSSGIRAGDQTTRRALCPMRKPRSALTPRTTAASPPVNTGRVARDAPHDNILTTSCTWPIDICRIKPFRRNPAENN